ncbi:prolyl 4-hydroxylase subunit alpha [Plasmodium brasilianum]|uniref:Prolyl 4-hydroxylase subunit alpha, putative n=2 Tax=Plasmodium (Plasmodium) TaxID=418103 RepID=A0A1A8X2F4_PLAMA|nr:prolyl 4-hydroxylase subunit alpha, putative [Plasmodium malariae]KAI4839935.1 prolyl 4-hydroxylase subunit alpha [Plasmodium brasilianum]SBS98776.1 prolyl 4-hydroxylase subunit alpha, putative [Plasmodium malariae]SBT87304.1 prolyl 4-hydroxylase subunit alpha, putative [Plasmodium malariae]
MDIKKKLQNSRDEYDNNDEKEKYTNIKRNEENFEARKNSDIYIDNYKMQKEKEDEFGIILYDNEIKYSDDMQTIVRKVINEKNIDFYKKYSSFLLYLSNETEYNEIDENNTIDKNNANDENTKVFFKIQLAPQNMSIIYNIIDKKMIEKILSLCANKYKKSKTSVGYITDKQEHYKITNSINRTSSTVFLYTIRNRSVIEENKFDNQSSIVYTKDESIIELENTICNLVKIPLCYLEPLAIVKYEKDNYFNLHHDGTFRRATLLIYLNDVNKDGETIFPYYNLTIKPIQGSGIFWYNNIPVEEEYAITYCVNRINKIYEQEKLTHSQNFEGNINTTPTKESIKNVHYPSSKNEQPPEILHSNSKHEFPNENKKCINKTMDLINFLSEKSNLQKFSIDVINDELGNMYIADMTMLHQANKVTEESKYVINCFFNVNIVRNV